MKCFFRSFNVDIGDCNVIRLGGPRDAQDIAVAYNDAVIYPDKVRLNCYYYRNYLFWTDIKMVFATIIGKKLNILEKASKGGV